ncbi:M56 family metallopeptidase [Flavobacterium sp. FlaQc-48]|uniref:M56 family metallopeptidase n=1 Tax=Flavobacterium sp. FlaQc-48 TaxID=3374181 RepID=UPI0037572781
MEALFTYIIKSGGLLILFYCAYYFLLRKETFFNSNRWFLLGGLFTSVILPFIVYTKTVWIDPAPVSDNNYQIYAPPANPGTPFVIDWNLALIVIYSIGFLALMIKLAFDFYSLNSVLKGKKIQQQADFKFIDVKENIAPFSYFEYIVYNSSLYSASELESIIEHEKVHSEQNHTIDVLVSRMFCVLFWFNPIIWLYKKSVLQNLEFIADSEAAQKIADKKAYQYTLLKITTHENCVAITNHFYQSLIKKRIIMLNKNQSKKRNSWKFGVIIPALAAFVLLFQVEVIAKEKELVKREVSIKLSKEKIAATDVYKIRKNTTDQELKVMSETLKQKYGFDVVVSDLKRNADNELTSFKLDLTKGSKLSKTFQIGGSKAINDCGIIVTTNHDGSNKISFMTDNDISATKITQQLKAEEKEDSNPNPHNNSNKNTNANQDNNAEANRNPNKIASAGTSTNVINTDTNTSVTVHVNSDTKTGTVIKVSSKKDGNTKELTQLVVVDGVVISEPVTIEELEELNIKTMDVYKGSQAIVKFGEQGKNGVIVIETKK